jgi:parvulin-like peptidyl-prolyl isomerase
VAGKLRGLLQQVDDQDLVTSISNQLQLLTMVIQRQEGALEAAGLRRDVVRPAVRERQRKLTVKQAFCKLQVAPVSPLLSHAECLHNTMVQCNTEDLGH